jgi:hypothetical protein
MTDEREFEDLAAELHETRERPRPEFAHELDRRAAGWLREKPRRRMPSMRIAVPALGAGAAAAALIVALAVSGGGDGDGAGERAPLEVAVVPEGPLPGAAPQSGGAAPDALETPLQRESTSGGNGAFLLLTKEGETATVRYLFSTPAEARVALAGREAEVQIEPGPGSLEISTAGLPAGTHELTITAPPAPVYRERLEVGG